MKRLSTVNFSRYAPYLIVICGFILVQALNAAGMVGASMRGQLVPICVWISMAVSLNLTVGISGELSLGHAGFMSVGAFTGTVCCIALENAVASANLRLAVSILVGASAAGIAGLMIGIPVLRLRGDYLAIVTLAFGEIIKNIITCVYVARDESGMHFGFLTSIADMHLGDEAKTIIDGPMGAVGISKLSTFTHGFVLILATLFVVLNLTSSRSGRAIMALRDNRIAAESVGISATKYKLMAFITSAVLAGAAGVVYAMNYSSVTASKFNFNQSILVLVFVVLGGLGNITGSILAASALTILPELLRSFSQYRMLVYALTLIFVMIFSNSPGLKSLLSRLSRQLRGILPRPKEEGRP